jgi:urease accessory protein
LLVLQVFRSLPVADRTYREEDVPAAARNYARDTITLGWEDRLRVRGRRMTDAAAEFGTALPRGTVLRGGDCFVLDALRVIVRVIERAEPVFVIEPRTPPEWGVIAYQIGNCHQPIMITGRAIVCPDVAGMEPLLRQHGIACVRATMPFTPSAVGPEHRHGVE